MNSLKQHSLFIAMLSSANSILEQIYSHPFNQQLADGTLSKIAFSQFLMQDQLYLGYYLEAMIITSNRLTKKDHKGCFQKFLKETGELQDFLKNELVPKYNPAAMAHKDQKLDEKVIMSTACLKYSQYLVQTAKEGSIEEAVTCLFPCFYVYHELGSQGSSSLSKDNYYYDWIAGYTNQQGFTESVEAFMQILIDVSNRDNEIESNQIGQTMANTFLQSCQHEWNFIQAVVQAHIPTAISDKLSTLAYLKHIVEMASRSHPITDTDVQDMTSLTKEVDVCLHLDVRCIESGNSETVVS